MFFFFFAFILCAQLQFFCILFMLALCLHNEVVNYIPTFTSSLLSFPIPIPLFYPFLGDLGLRLAGVSHEVYRSADVGAPDVPNAPEHNPALCQTQP